MTGAGDGEIEQRAETQEAPGKKTERGGLGEFYRSCVKMLRGPPYPGLNTWCSQEIKIQAIGKVTSPLAPRRLYKGRKATSWLSRPRAIDSSRSVAGASNVHRSRTR